MPRTVGRLDSFHIHSIIRNTDQLSVCLSDCPSVEKSIYPLCVYVCLVSSTPVEDDRLVYSLSIFSSFLFRIAIISILGGKYTYITRICVYIACKYTYTLCVYVYIIYIYALNKFFLARGGELGGALLGIHYKYIEYIEGK